jgi:hypothetical protein
MFQGSAAFFRQASLRNVGRDAVSVKIRKALSRHFDFEADFKGDFS